MKPIYGLAAFTLSAMLTAAYAQGDGKTDTGGGMGGTGNSSDKFPMAEIGASIAPKCFSDIAIGKITRFQGTKSLSEPICDGSTAQTTSGETLTLSFIRGGELKAEESSRFTIQHKTDEKIKITLEFGLFRINQKDNLISYQIKHPGNKQAVNLVGNALQVSIIKGVHKGEYQNHEAIIEPSGYETIMVNTEIETAEIRPGYRGYLLLDSDGSLLRVRKNLTRR